MLHTRLKRADGKEHGAYFANEQPEPSWLYAEPPWPQVLAHPSVDKVIFDQCQLGLRDRRGGILQKTTGLVSNAREILAQFENLRCPGRHQHVHITGNNSEDAQIWPWRLAERLVQGIVDLRRRLRRTGGSHATTSAPDSTSAFPAVGVGASEGEIDRDVAAERARYTC